MQDNTEKVNAIITALRGGEGPHKYNIGFAAANDESANFKEAYNALLDAGYHEDDIPVFCDWYADEDDCRSRATLAEDEGYAEWCEWAVNKCGALADAAIENLSTPIYEVWLVPSGVGFDQGYTGRNAVPVRGIMLASEDTIEAAREAVGRAADETFREDGGEYDRIFDECCEAHPEQADEGFSEPEEACKKFVEEAKARLFFDAGDQKYVRVREVRMNANGTNTIFIRAL